MVGYTIRSGDSVLYVRLLASNPYLSAEKNFAAAAVSNEDTPLDTANYNWLWDNPNHYEAPLVDKTLKVQLISIDVYDFF